MNIKPPQLINALLSLPEKERQRIFSKEINDLTELKSALDNDENIFEPYEEKADRALQKVIFFFRKMTGYNCGWVAEAAIEHCSHAGRRIKYSTDKRLSNCILIDQISKRGCSPRQAIILLAKMMDDINVTLESTQKELTDSYREYKNRGLSQNYQEITDIGWVIADMLNFDLSKEHSSDEKAFLKALEAHKAFWQDVINLMKQYHPVIAKYDNDYPKIFGCVIEWLKQNYDNPIEYFYKPPSHKTIALTQRRRCLAMYIDTMSFLRTKSGKPIE